MKLNTRFLAVSALILIAVVSRIVPHLPNFTALSAIALFGAAQYDKKIMAFIVPLIALFISDVILYFYPIWPGAHPVIDVWVYITFVLIILAGFVLRNNVTVPRVIALSVVSSLLVFIITDFGVWLGTMYPHTWAGFIACYADALSFFRYELLGDLFYSGLLFGTFYLAQLKFPTLSKQRIQ